MNIATIAKYVPFDGDTLMMNECHWVEFFFLANTMTVDSAKDDSFNDGDDHGNNNDSSNDDDP